MYFSHLNLAPKSTPEPHPDSTEKSSSETHPTQNMAISSNLQILYFIIPPLQEFPHHPCSKTPSTPPQDLQKSSVLD